MKYPVTSWSGFGSFAVLFTVSLSCIIKVRRGSRSKFAYVLLSFVLVSAINDMTFAIGDNYSWTVAYSQSSDEQLNFIHFQISMFNNYLYDLLSLQTWIFAFQYLDSAYHGSLKNTCCSRRVVHIVKWVGIAVYVIGQTICLLIIIITFPSYFSDGSN